MSDALKINFILPPCPNISGGPLAILEYANRFADRGHTVSVTTFPKSLWGGEHPFPWFDLKASLHYIDDSETAADPTPKVSDLLHQAMTARTPPLHSHPLSFLIGESISWARIIEATPECDINIATLWSTAFPAYLSRKGKPVMFMQHYEEIFSQVTHDQIMQRLGVRMSYALPIYKIANSSWLQRVFEERYGQLVPFSNNGIDISDFNPRPKKSEKDGIIRIITYARPEQWKGFADAVAAMKLVRERLGSRVEWHVFGYMHPDLRPDNDFAPYQYHPKLSFKALAELYATSDIALCPSWYESFPLPALEAMASGTAPITTEYGTEDYAFDGGNALVVGSRDIPAMADAVVRLVTDKNFRDRIAIRGRETALKFGWDAAVEKREQLLLDIHHDRISYDVNKSAWFGEKDANGIEFERSPRDIVPSTGIFWDGPHLYLFANGLKHHVVRGELISTMMERGAAYIEPDPLTVARTPVGSPVVTVSDLPHNLSN